jgi:hypothetical protein
MKNTTLLLVLLTLNFNLFSQQTKSPFVYNNVKLGEFKIVEGITSADGVPIKSAYNNPKTIFIVLDSIISDSLISEIKKSYPNTTVKYNDSITNYLTLNTYTQYQ